jgi:ABC-2 type transport system permease protein
MTFEQVFVYMSLAGSIFILFKTWVDWFMSYDIVEGIITRDLLKPIDYQFYLLITTFGSLLFNLTLITVPSVVALLIFFPSNLVLGINLLFFLLSLCLAYLLSFAVDYITGVTSFYTESIWGISSTKEMVVLLLSGGLIPLRFFPEGIQNVLYYLPFQAIYNAPLTILTDPGLDVPDYLNMLGLQLVWVTALIIVSRLFFAQASKALTVNGG